MKNRFRNPLTALASLVAAIGSLAMASPPPIGRTLPDAVHYSDASTVLVVSGDCLRAASATDVDGRWADEGSLVDALSTINDGAIVNNGATDALVVSLAGTGVYRLAAGESMVIGSEASAGYIKGCICTCGTGDVFLRTADCGGSQCQGPPPPVLPCIDPITNQASATGLTNCRPGYGSSLFTE